MEILTILIGIGILLAIPLVLFLFALIGIVIFVFIGGKICKGKPSDNDDFMRMHNNFMDDSRRAHETHMNMHNNMFH